MGSNIKKKNCRPGIRLSKEARYSARLKSGQSQFPEVQGRVISSSSAVNRISGQAEGQNIQRPDIRSIPTTTSAK